jgi:hypothetical protein
MIFLSGFVSTLLAQDIPQPEVPAAVLNTFQSKFPDAKDADWEMDGDLYKVDFEIGKREHDLWIDKSGIIKKHKEDFPKSKLPAAIHQKLKSDFATYTIDDADKFEEDGKVRYKIKLKSPTGEREVWLDADGSVKEALK